MSAEIAAYKAAALPTLIAQENARVQKRFCEFFNVHIRGKGERA